MEKRRRPSSGNTIKPTLLSHSLPAIFLTLKFLLIYILPLYIPHTNTWRHQIHPGVMVGLRVYYSATYRSLLIILDFKSLNPLMLTIVALVGYKIHADVMSYAVTLAAGAVMIHPHSPYVSRHKLLLFSLFPFSPL